MKKENHRKYLLYMKYPVAQFYSHRKKVSGCQWWGKGQIRAHC